MYKPYLFGPPGWVLRPGGNLANLDMDFANGRYFAKGGPNAVASLLTTTRASAANGETLGSVVVPFPANTPCITDRGVPVELAATNVVLWNRDLTNAVWTKTNCTAAKDQTGADGVLLSASSLTATAGNATCLQAITLGSSNRLQSAYVKRLTGSGTIQMTTDGGGSWTTISVTSSFTPLTIPSQLVTNPSIGFRIVTSGDAIAVDYVQNETGLVRTTPIGTTSASVTRAFTQIASSALQTLLANAQGTLLVSCGVNNAVGFPRVIGSGAALTKAAALYFNVVTPPSTGQFGTYDATTVRQTATTLDASSVVKGAVAWSGSSLSVVGGGGTVLAAAQTFSSGSPVYIGSNGVSEAINSYIRRITAWPYRLSDAQLQALTV